MTAHRQQEMEDNLNIRVPDDEDWAEISAMSEPPNIEAELERFREQWHREIQQQYREYTPGDTARSDAGTLRVKQEVELEEPSEEEQARFLFMQGVNAEQLGRVYDAILYYRRAIKLVPDIESRIGEFGSSWRVRVREESESSMGLSDVGELDDDDDLTDLVQHFQRTRLLMDERSICHPNIDQRAVHISSLPFEVLTYIFKWVISSDLDIHSLEQLSAVCRGFYLCARDEELWRLICIRTWGLNCGNPGTYGSYRHMFIQRPHLRYNGCYIAKSTYYRQGEKGLDNCCRPFHVVEYYRYVRFFPEGKVLMLTTPDDPMTALPKLRTRSSAVAGLLTGYYKLAGDRVNLVLKRNQTNDYLSSLYRYRRQKNPNPNSDVEQNFDAEFTVRSVNGKPHWQLIWTHYDVRTIYRSGEETIVDFELNNKSYPSLLFSRVRSFTAYSDSPLQ